MDKQYSKRTLSGLIVLGLFAAQSAMAIKIGPIELPTGEDWNPFGKKGIPIQIVSDAKFPEVAKLNKIGVPTFKGQAGIDFTASLRDELSSATVNGEKVFTLSGVMDGNAADSPRNLVAQGRRAGLDAVYVGDTALGGNRAIPEKEEYCEGGLLLLGKCRGGEMKTRTCWTVKGVFTANIQVIRTSDGNTVYEERKSESVEEKHCESISSAMIQPTELALKAKDMVIEAIKADIMPRTETHRVQLMSSTRGLSKEDKETFKEGVDWAKQKELNRACGMWEELKENSTSAAKFVGVIYNLGVCAEYQQDYTTAQARYREAFSLAKPRDAKLIRAGLDRVQSAQAATGR